MKFLKITFNFPTLRLPKPAVTSNFPTLQLPEDLPTNDFKSLVMVDNTLPE